MDADINATPYDDDVSCVPTYRTYIARHVRIHRPDWADHGLQLQQNGCLPSENSLDETTAVPQLRRETVNCRGILQCFRTSNSGKLDSAVFCSAIFYLDTELTPIKMKRLNGAAFLLFLSNALSSHHAFVPTLTSTRFSSTRYAASEVEASTLDVTRSILEMEPGSLDYFDDVTWLLLSWGKQETEEGAIMVEKLIERFEKEAELESTTVIINCVHYTVAIDAWGKSGHQDATINAERLLDKMNEMAKENRDYMPTRATYNALMNAHSKQGNVGRVLEILESMEESSEIEPVTNDYNVMLGAFAKQGYPRKAEEVLKRMVDRCKDLGQDCPCSPDMYSYNVLLDAWAKSSERGKGKRAEEMFTHLTKLCDSDDCDWELDARTCASVINAIVHSDESDRIQRSEAIMATAKARGVAPDSYLYTALLEAYANTQDSGAAEKAEEVLNALEKEGFANSVAYNTVLKAWKNQRSSKATRRAESLVERMRKLSIADTISYSTLISIYANQGDKESTHKIDSILHEMQEAGLQPNAQVMNTGMYGKIMLTISVVSYEM